MIDWTTVAVSAAAAAIVSTLVALATVAWWRSNQRGLAECAAGRHRFQTPGGMPLPIAYCSRRGCNKEAVSAYVAPNLAVQLHNAIPPDRRFPPVHMDDAGNAYPIEGVNDDGYANTSRPPEAAEFADTPDVPVGTTYSAGPDGVFTEDDAPAQPRGWLRRRSAR